MEQVRLDPRLAALFPVIEEFKALKRYLQEVSLDRTNGQKFDSEIRWIDNALQRIEPHLHECRWPPVWWRLGKEDFDLVIRNFEYVDSNGKYFDHTRQDHGATYIPERAEIMIWIARIKEMYERPL